MTFIDDVDPYGTDVLADFTRRPPRRVLSQHEAVEGLVVEELSSGWCGAVTRLEGRLVELEDRHGSRRLFPLGDGFAIDGEPVALVAPKQEQRVARTASGSRAAPRSRARVAVPSCILVEGRHDAELVERIWGDDLRVEGVVVEYLGGIDDLDGHLAEFSPGPGRRAGVLVDHLVPGSKESRIAEAVARGPHAAHVLVVGHPFVDVWQAVKPVRLGIEAWPVVPREIEWKRGVCAALGLPYETQADIANAWRRILGTVRGFADLEPSFLGRVEELIDFVTTPEL